MPTLIEEKDVTDVLLCKFMEEAATDFRIDEEGDIYVLEPEFPFWIRFHPEKKFLEFMTYSAVKNTTEATVLGLSNRCNEDIFLLSTFYVPKLQRLYGCYFMPYRYGLIREQFLQLVRRFGGSFRTILTTIDVDDILGAE